MATADTPTGLPDAPSPPPVPLRIGGPLTAIMGQCDPHGGWQIPPGSVKTRQKRLHELKRRQKSFRLQLRPKEELFGEGSPSQVRTLAPKFFERWKRGKPVYVILDRDYDPVSNRKTAVLSEPFPLDEPFEVPFDVAMHILTTFPYNRCFVEVGKGSVSLNAPMTLAGPPTPGSVEAAAERHDLQMQIAARDEQLAEQAAQLARQNALLEQMNARMSALEAGGGAAVDEDFDDIPAAPLPTDD